MPDIEKDISRGGAMLNAPANAERQYAAIHLCKGDADCFLRMYDHRNLYDVAKLYRSQMKSQIGKMSLEEVSARIPNADRVSREDFYEMYAQKLSADEKVAAVMIVNFDSGKISICDNDGGLWKNYFLKDASAAVHKAERKTDLTTDMRKAQFDTLIQRKLDSFFLDGDMDENDLCEDDMETTGGMAMTM